MKAQSTSSLSCDFGKSCFEEGRCFSLRQKALQKQFRRRRAYFGSRFDRDEVGGWLLCP